MRRRRGFPAGLNVCLLGVALVSAQESVNPPSAFEVATVKPLDPGGEFRGGFRSYPGGRIEFGGSVKWLMTLAFDVQRFQVMGGPDWSGADGYDVVALPPNQGASSSGAKSDQIRRTPTREERQMLQGLLAERFGLRFHPETREGPVYILARGKEPLQLEEPKDKDRDPVCVVFIRGEIADGEVRASNAPLDEVARVLSTNLQAVVVNKTGISGAYDFHVLPFDSTNRDVVWAMTGAMDRLGLKLEPSKGPVEAIVIDSMTRPTPN